MNNAGVATQFPYNLTVDGVESTFQVRERRRETTAMFCWFCWDLLMGYRHYPHLMG
jgi:hypothetical protein